MIKSALRLARRPPRRAIGPVRWSSQTTRPPPQTPVVPAAPSSTARVVLAYVVGTVAGIYFGTRLVENSGKDAKSSTFPLAATTVPKYGSEADQKKAFAEIAEIVGIENTTVVAEELHDHSDTSWTTQHATELERPGIVVFPSSTAEVSQVIKVAHKYRIPVTPFSGGTSLEGNFIPSYGGLCIDFRNMDNILELHKGDLDVIVQPGVGWEGLNDYLADYDLFFPPDPGPGAQIGGMIGTSCSGTNAARYGTMKDYVINLTVVLADGTVIKTKQRPRKTAAGYNLNGIFVGSEGTLGIVTEATLKLVPKPKNETVSVVTFNSISEASQAVQNIIQSGVQVGAVELLDDKMMQAINLAGTTGKTWKETTTIFFKFHGTRIAIDDQIKQVRDISKKYNALTFEFARNPDDIATLWSARKNALFSTIATAPEGYHVWSTDVCVPVSHLAEIISETKEDIVASKLLGTMVGHVGDGNFHACIVFDPKTQFERTEGVVHRMVERALELEGTCTGEHGVGIGKRDFLVHEVGEKTLDTMRSIKHALDPLNLLNPGKIFRSFEEPERR